MDITKISKILLIITGITSCVACKKEPTENFPYAQVNVTLNLISNPIGAGTAIVCPNSSNQGALGKGIIVFNTGNYGDVNYIAYSALCTNYPKDTSAVVITSSGNEAQCPKCKSLFFLLDGSVLKGPAQYPLKQYSVSTISDGNTLVIQN